MLPSKLTQTTHLSTSSLVISPISIRRSTDNVKDKPSTNENSLGGKNKKSSKLTSNAVTISGGISTNWGEEAPTHKQLTL